MSDSNLHRARLRTEVQARAGVPPLPNLSEDEIRVIRERHSGPEQATCKLLGRVFGVSAQKIARIVNDGRTIL